MFICKKCFFIEVAVYDKEFKQIRSGGQGCVLKPLFHFSFFLQLFHFFALIVALLSSSLLPAHSSCPSFLLVPPRPSSSLFLTRPAPSESFRIRKRPFFIDFDESVTDQPTNGRTNGRTDKASYRDARTHIKTPNCI